MRANVPPKRKLGEFRVTEDALLPIGTHLLAGHFVCGQHVDVCAKRCALIQGLLCACLSCRSSVCSTEAIDQLLKFTNLIGCP